MEEERLWRLERNEGNSGAGPQKGMPSPHDMAGKQWTSGGQGPSNSDESSSPTMGETTGVTGISMEESESVSAIGGIPQVKFNGIPYPKPAVHAPIPTPPTASMQMNETYVETDVSVTEVTVDVGWTLTDLLCVLYDCSCQCQRTLTCIVNSPEARVRARQIAMLRDCAEICHTAWCFLQRNSRFSLKVLKLCAQICEACADGCSTHLDLESQRCAATCMRCAAACRAFIAANS